MNGFFDHLLQRALGPRSDIRPRPATRFEERSAVVAPVDDVDWVAPPDGAPPGMLASPPVQRALEATAQASVEPSAARPQMLTTRSIGVAPTPPAMPVEAVPASPMPAARAMRPSEPQSFGPHRAQPGPPGATDALSRRAAPATSTMAPPLQPLQPPPPRESHAPIAADEQSPADGATAATSSPTPPPASHDPPAAPVTPRLQQSNRSVEPDRHSASHPPGGELATSAAPAQRQTTAAAELRQTRAAAVAPAPLLPVFQDVAVMSHERSADTTPTVHVTIGRIDIRATVAPPAAAPPARRVLPSRPALSLSDYLQRRQGGRS